MANKTWSGANGSYTDGGQWTPAGTPGVGDTATISTGTVLANGVTFASGTVVVVNDPNVYSSSVYPTLAIQGTVTNAGILNLTGSASRVTFASGSTLVNTGTMTLASSSPVFAAAVGNTLPTIQNNGQINVVNPANGFQAPTMAAAIAGSGLITLSSYGRLDIQQSISATQTLAFSGGVNGGAVLQIDSPSTFGARISNFTLGNTITVSNTPFTSASYTSTGASSGRLNLLSGGTTTGSINFNGVYNINNFTLTFTPLGGTAPNGSPFSNLTIGTNVTNAATGSTTQTVPPVFRFFDTSYGTHFFTASVGERDDVLANRSDLVEETNGFGAVAQNAPASAPVYRFFDTKFGTHFFTASASERDGVIANRSDLTYEPSSTFYEHNTQQTGDVPVYRFFDNKFGTHFYTGDQSEYNAITTPGSSGYRADLVYEKVEFFAPAGTFV